MPRFGSPLALLVLLASDVGCRKSSVEVPPPDAGVPATPVAAPTPIEGRGITMSHVWTWSPRDVHVAGGAPVETFVTLAATAGYLRAPAKSVRLVTASGARIPVADPVHSTCAELLALGETRGCAFLFEVPIAETAERLELSVPPEPAIEVALANPPPTSRPCVADAPCTPCSFPVSGMECQNRARARGLEPACAFREDTSLGRKITLYCPPGYRAPP
jgi:hypothetical protein